MANRHINNVNFEKLFEQVKKGDVIFVKDGHGNTRTHSIISFGETLVGDLYPTIVHAGIVLNSHTTVEMSGNGIGHFGPQDIHGEEVTVFRCKDEMLSNLAADLAYNLEHTLLKQRLIDLQNYAKEPDAATYDKKVKDIKYATYRAFASVLNDKINITEEQINELQELVAKLDFNLIGNKMYCSESVILLYNMSALILYGPQALKGNPAINRNIHYTDPSELYHFMLTNHDSWEKVELAVPEVAQRSTVGDMTRSGQLLFSSSPRNQRPKQSENCTPSP